MASNFKIYSFKTSDSLHLKLTGNFDGSSAYELINTLADYGKGFYEIFINTNDLKRIHPFGIQVFQNRFTALKKQFNGIIFVGRNKQEMGSD
jgi:anti-anti-sigma regulatory factor